jgi:hypothetical protein
LNFEGCLLFKTKSLSVLLSSRLISLRHLTFPVCRTKPGEMLEYMLAIQAIAENQTCDSLELLIISDSSETLIISQYLIDRLIQSKSQFKKLKILKFNIPIEKKDRLDEYLKQLREYPHLQDLKVDYLYSLEIFS